MSNRIRIDIRMVGYETELVEMLRFLGAVQYLGSIGASRDLNLSVDGDGSGQVRFEVLWGDSEEYKELESTKIDTGSSKDTFKFYLGE
jgi:hypothetical protein